MLDIELLTKLFKEDAYSILNVNDNYKSRKCNEYIYFQSYLMFLNNSSYLSRYILIKMYLDKINKSISPKTISSKVK